jgi:hypothetical protein
MLTAPILVDVQPSIIRIIPSPDPIEQIQRSPILKKQTEYRSNTKPGFCSGGIKKHTQTGGVPRYVDAEVADLQGVGQRMSVLNG